MSARVADRIDDHGVDLLVREIESADEPSYLTGDMLRGQCRDQGRGAATGGDLPQLGLGKAGAGMKAAILNRAIEMESASGRTGADGAASKAGFAGEMAGQRSLGTRSANINLAAEEAAQTFPLARSASAAISRTGFIPFTHVQQMIQAGNNNPQLAAFNAANQAVITTYSRAVSPTGQPTVNSSEHARALISTAPRLPAAAMLPAEDVLLG